MKKLSLILICFIFVFFWREQIHADQYLDMIEISGANLAMQAPRFKAQVVPPERTALEKLLQEEPLAIVISDDGKSWSIRRRNSDKLEVVDKKISPLGPDDQKALARLLKIDYVQKWVGCMRRAWEGRADLECAKILASMAAEEKDQKTSEVLLANLGGRILALSSQNPSWERYLLAEKIPPVIAKALYAYSNLESQKARAVVNIRNKVLTNSNIWNNVYVVAAGTVQAGDSNISWDDFSNSVKQYETSSQKPRVFTWKAMPSGNLTASRPGESGWTNGVLTYYLSGSQQILIAGDLEDKFIHRLRTAKTAEQGWATIIAETSTNQLNVFLSRPGSSQLGEMLQGKKY